MNELREDLDRALRTLTVNEAPVERTRLMGHRIRTRRRVTLVAVALAVVAVAAGYPALARNSAAPGTPSVGRSAKPAPHKPHGADPVVMAGPGPNAKMAADGMASANGEVASGAVGGESWRVTVHGPGSASPVPGDSCYLVEPGTFGDFAGSCQDIPATMANRLGANDPAAFTGSSDPVSDVVVGEAAPQVTFLIVNFSDGQSLKLIPVTVGGHRYVAWIAPVSMTITSVVAHIGGPYFDSGVTATQAPFYPPGQQPVAGRWRLSGQ